MMLGFRGERWPAFLAWVLVVCFVVAEMGRGCVTVTDKSLRTIVPFSKICNVSTEKALRFQGANLTGVTFDFLESTLGVSFDENCTLDRMRINGILINQKLPRMGVSSVRLRIDSPLKDARILLIRVAGKTEFTKRIIRSTIGGLISDQDISFLFPVTGSSIGRISPETSFVKNTVSFIGRVIDTSIAYIASRTIKFDDLIKGSNVTSLAAKGLYANVRIAKAESSSFGSITGDYMYLDSLSKCSVGEAAASQFVSMSKVKRSSFQTVVGEGLYSSSSEFSPGSVYLNGISGSYFGSIHSGYDDNNDYDMEFTAPVRNSKFDRLQGYVKFRAGATLYGSKFNTVVSKSNLLWQNRMERTRFRNVTTTGYLFMLTNTSANIASTYGDLTGYGLAFYEPMPSTLSCSSISVITACGVIVNRVLQERTCPACVA